jgi:hypothetical protein
MQLDKPEVSLAADQALGSRFAQITKMSLTRVSKFLGGAVDLAATVAKGVHDAGIAAKEAMKSQVSNVGNLLEMMALGEEFDAAAAFEGVD